MKIAIVSDVHSNLEALERVLEEIQNEKVEQIYSLGDMVGYNANPVECLQLIREKNVLCVAGNHDYASVGLTDIEFFNPFAKKAALWSGKQLKLQDRDFIQSLPLVRNLDTITFVHATLDHPEEWGYILSEKEAAESFRFQQTPLCFVGHSHYPGVFEEGGSIQLSPEGPIKLKKGARHIVNVGSVGQPRDGDPRSCFVIFDPDHGTVDFRRLDYDIEKTQEKVLAAGLPEFLAARLALGR